MSAKKGAAFCELTRRAIATTLGMDVETEVSLPVGSPPRPHKFDLATPDRAYIGEAKAFTWTSGNNIPSAKISTVKEALQFLHALPQETRTFVVMRRDLRISTGEALADYFVRLHGHWLGTTTLLELAVDTSALRFVSGGTPVGRLLVEATA
jgi:hypothetical protein